LLSLSVLPPMGAGKCSVSTSETARTRVSGPAFSGH
jgi:hypothetical protein